MSGLLEDIERGVDEGELFRAIMLKNKEQPRRARELIYIFRKLKALKGGNIQ